MRAGRLTLAAVVVAPVAVDATKAYAALDDAPDAGAPAGSIVSVAKEKSGGPLTVIATAQLHPRLVAVCGATIAWVVSDVAPNDSAVVVVAR